jgi:hypothetical protein
MVYHYSRGPCRCGACGGARGMTVRMADVPSAGAGARLAGIHQMTCIGCSAVSG